MVVSYQICLGWNGNYNYGCVNGSMTIKNVDGTKSVTNSDGVNTSPRESWNNNYYINAKIANIAIESFVLD